MKTRIIRIGNSRGVRIPSVLLNQTKLNGEVELEAHRDQIIIRPRRRPRQGWQEAFRKMAENSDDRLLDSDVHIPTRWEEEWEWK